MKIHLPNFIKEATWLVLFLPVYASSQPSSNIEEALKAGQFNKVRSMSEQILSQDTNNVKVLSCLGEYFFHAQKYDSAFYVFTKAKKKHPDDAYCKINLGKTLLQLNRENEATLYFQQAIKSNKKNAAVRVAVGFAYINGVIKNPEIAVAYADQARQLKQNLSDIYLLEGKVDLLKKDFNNAAMQFEQAVYFDSTTCEGRILLSTIYIQSHNYKEALSILNTSLEVNPYCTEALKTLGELYYQLGQYAKAIEAYKKYLATSEYTTEDEEKYAYCLFFNKDYRQALEEITKLSEREHDNRILYRITGYMQYEKGEYQIGKQALEKFFDISRPEQCIASDYLYYGKILLKLGIDSLAVCSFQKALSIDASNNECLYELARLFNREKQYNNAAKYYELYLKTIPIPQPSDIFLLGKTYYGAAGTATDSIRKNDALKKADSLFCIISRISPDSYLGYLWQARVNALLDPESITGLARPYYEKAISMMVTDTTKYKEELIEAYSYLGYYYFLKKDKENSQLNWGKILGIDPKNDKATKALKALKNAK